MAVLLLALAASLAACGGGAAGTATVPKLVGLSEQAALGRLAAAHLAAVPGLQFSDTYAAGVVARQDPAAGAQVSAGDNESIWVSRGARLVTLPDLRAQLVDGVAQWLREHGLLVNVVQGRSARVGPGQIFQQEPAAGMQVTIGWRVTLWQNSGLPQVKVPDVRGMSLVAARKALGGARLSFDGSSTEHSASVPVGEVSGQSVPPGGRVAGHTAIQLSVSSGPGPAVKQLPALVGRPQAAAFDLLWRRGFRAIEIVRQPSASAPAGQVLAQSPAGGQQVATRSPLQLIVSTGSQPLPAVAAMVPSVVGVTLAHALRHLKEAGFLEVVIDSTPFGRGGHVAGQSPTAGSSYSTQRIVTLLVTQ